MCIADLWNWLSSNVAQVIAGCALFATFIQAYISWKNNRLSVSPYLTTWEQEQDGYVVFTIHNYGVGPARIKSFEIFVDGIEVSGEKLERHEKCLKKVFPESKYTFEWYGSYLGVDYMMPVNQGKVLAAIRFTSLEKPNKDEFEHAIKRIKVLIHYESIYKDKFIFDSIEEMKKQQNVSS